MRLTTALVFMALSSCATATHERSLWGRQPTASKQSQKETSASQAKGGALHSHPLVVVSEPKTEELPQNNSTDETPVFRWPLMVHGISSLFGERQDPFDKKRRFHSGVDLDAPYGTLVGAAANGVVLYAGWAPGHGRQVVVQHTSHYQTVYSHLSRILVFTGNRVEAGDNVGQVGNSGRSTGPHLHFEVRLDNRPIDPLSVVDESQLQQ